ncbi:MAG: hypothetical protein MRQ09_06220 [Candidatus Midichloria sp.]|nr:hypothetical protein [Candidatus Midichloria sp.]
MNKEIDNIAQTKEASTKEEVKTQTIKGYKELTVKLEAVKVELQKLGYSY